MDWEGEEEYDEEVDDAEYDAEAQEIAKRLGDQLWADITKAQLEAGLVNPTSSQGNGSGVNAPTSRVGKKEAALATMRNIIALAGRDQHIQAAMKASTVANSSVLDILNQCLTSNAISKSLAKPLADSVLLMAKNDVLFPPGSLDQRKQDILSSSTGAVTQPSPSSRPPLVDFPNVAEQVSDAVQAVVDAFNANPSDTNFVSSMHTQLHRIFLFTITSLPLARPEHHPALNEVTGLIQMLGMVNPGAQPLLAFPAGTSTDIETAVYPCTIPACPKVFSRLYSLRAHSRAHTASDRPFRCSVCQVSFSRSHDLKRHARMHDRRAYKCGGCDKIFSRRDAIKRHKDTRGRAAAGGKVSSGDSPTACAYADVIEVELGQEGDDDIVRRAKTWNESQTPGPVNLGIIEDGEIPRDVLEQTQAVVLNLHPILQDRIATTFGFGAPPPAVPHNVPAPHPPAHATLASVLDARSQAPNASSPAPPPMASLQAPPTPSGASSDAPQMNTAKESSSSLAWLSSEQTRMLEEAIAQAAAAAQAQAEAEAELEEEEEDGDDDAEGQGLAGDVEGEGDGN